MGFAGLNITHPCKQLVIPLLDELSRRMRARSGAVNTVVLRDGAPHRPQHRLVGLRRGVPPQHGRRAARPRGADGRGRRGRRGRARGADAGRRPTDHPSMLMPPAPQALADALCGRFGAARAVACGATRPRPWREADGLINARRSAWRSILACRCRPSLLRPGAVGRRDRLFPAGDRAAAHRPRAWLPHPRRRRHGGVPGGRGVPPVHRHHARRRADAAPLR